MTTTKATIAFDKAMESLKAQESFCLSDLYELMDLVDKMCQIMSSDAYLEKVHEVLWGDLGEGDYKHIARENVEAIL